MTLGGAPDIAKLVGERDISGLIKALAYPHQWWVREEAARALAGIGAPAVGPLLAALRNTHPYVRAGAATAMGEIGDTRAIPPLIAAVRDESRHVVAAADSALNALWQPDTSALAAKYWVALGHWGRAASLGAMAVQPLIAVLRDTHAEADARISAAQELVKIGDVQAVGPLIAVLCDSDWAVRLSAAVALGKMGDARAVAPLSCALRDQDRFVRLAALRAMGQIGRPAVRPLICAVHHRDPGMRAAAAEALGEAGDVRAVTPLVASIRDKDRYVRKAAALALGNIGDARAVPALILLLGDEWRDVRARAARLLLALYRSGRLPESARSAILRHSDALGVSVERWRDSGLPLPSTANEQA